MIFSPSRLIVIPVHLGSKRMAQKALRKIGDKTLVQLTHEVAMQVPNAKVLVAASDNPELVECCSFADTIPTNPNLPNGTARVQQAVSMYLGKHPMSRSPEEPYVINLQMDEPCIDPKDITALFELSEATFSAVSTITAPLDVHDELNPNVVKACVTNGSCLWFSREMFSGAVGHVGVYCFAANALRAIGRLPPTILSRNTSLEQLSWIEHDWKINRLHIDRHPLSINSEADWEQFQAMKSRA